MKNLVTSQKHQILLQLTDTHLMAQGSQERLRGMDTSISLKAVLTLLKNFDPNSDALLLTGDLANYGDKSAYLHLQKIWSEEMGTYPAPTYCLPGNHDDASLLQDLLQPPLFLVDSVILPPWQLIFLDSAIADQTGGMLVANELAKLDKLLVQSSHFILIALHHPPVSIGSNWMDSLGLAHPQAFWNVVDRYPKVRGVVWGHIHQTFEATRKGVQLFGTPSTCIQFVQETPTLVLDEALPGYRRLRLYPDGKIESEVIRLENGDEICRSQNRCAERTLHSE